MGFNAKTLVARVVNICATAKSPLACRVRGLVEARRRRAAQDREFYRNLDAYCRANNLSPVCEDDWKTAVDYRKNDDLSIVR